MKHTGTQPFETERLVCRPFVQADCTDMLRNWISNPNVQLEYGEPVYSTMDQVKALLTAYISKYSSPDFYRWAIVEKNSKQNIGQIAFCRVYSDCRTAEIEYCIGEPFWGNGYASEALSALIDVTFHSTDFIRLEAYHRIENTRSGRVLEKSVMHSTELIERFIREQTIPHGEVCYCIEKHVYTAR
ncbi:MAG: GNAT family N-acetyltransferase [Ruminococcus sp.]|nr:GNAT family N-acetyltransferase [Ruminococcus sp.]